jgi:SAM-dependent methyltransferase
LRPLKIERHRRREADLDELLQARGLERAAEVEELGGHGAEPGGRVHHDREESDQEGDDDLRRLATDAPQFYGGDDVFTSHRNRADRVRSYTRAMHGTSMAPALAWPERVDLSGHRRMLDIGGGSGAHAIGAAQQWAKLQVIVFDLAPVCGLAEEFIARYGLEDRVRTQVGDMWTDTFPPVDLHFYSQIYHDWPPDRCRFLTRKSFEGLAPGGRVILHEMLYDDRKTGPFSTAAMNINMLLQYEAGRQYSGRELSAMLKEAGFSDIEVKPTFGYYSIVIGRKPG